MNPRTADSPRIVHRDRVGPAELTRVREIIAAATVADGVHPLDEAAMLELSVGTYLLVPSGRPDLRHDPSATEQVHDRPAAPELEEQRLGGFVRLVDGVDTASADVVVNPHDRRQGFGSQLLAEALRLTGPRELRIWAHGPHPGAEPLARAHDMQQTRVLWRMTRSLGPDAPELPEPSLPPESSHARIRTFEPGRDEDAWLAANATAFADHPEQGRLGRADLAERMAQPWFSPAGFFVAEPVDDPGRILGFHWTKVHPAEGDSPPIGEIYVLGVAEPTRGLATALALTGLRHLAGLGIRTVLLFTESDNEAAIRLYQRLGFAHTNSDVMYASVRA